MEEKTIAKVWLFKSASSPNKPPYETILYSDGTTSCGCRGWTMKKAGKERSCRHTRLVDMGQADRQCSSMNDYTKNKKQAKHIDVALKIVKNVKRPDIDNRLANIS